MNMTRTLLSVPNTAEFHTYPLSESSELLCEVGAVAILLPQMREARPGEVGPTAAGHIVG